VFDELREAVAPQDRTSIAIAAVMCNGCTIGRNNSGAATAPGVETAPPDELEEASDEDFVERYHA
jgi:hypothetical protein